MAPYTEDIISLCDRITAFCIRLNKRLDAAHPWQQERASFYQPDWYPPPSDPDPPYALPTYANHATTPPPNQPPQPTHRPTYWDPPGQLGSSTYGHPPRTGWPPQPPQPRPLQQQTYWEQHHQHQEPVLDQPPPQYCPSYWHPPSQHHSAERLPAAPPPAAISLPGSTDMRYGSAELFHRDIDESIQSHQIHYDDIVFDRLLNRDQHVEDDVLLNIEEVSHIANEIQLDPEMNDAIHYSDEVSFNLSNVEASKELIVSEVDSGFGRNELDNKWKYSDTICKQSKVGERIANIEKNFVMEKKDNAEDAPSNVVIPGGGDDAIISHHLTMLDTDARLIPPRDGTSCLGNHGHVAKLPVLR